jgi:hypothetical protein
MEQKRAREKEAAAKAKKEQKMRDERKKNSEIVKASKPTESEKTPNNSMRSAAGVSSHKEEEKAGMEMGSLVAGQNDDGVAV